MNYICDVCAWIYEEAAGAEDSGIGPGTKWEDVPEDFLCPLCAVGKDQFSKYDQEDIQFVSTLGNSAINMHARE